MRRLPWYSPVTATSRSETSRTGSPGSSEAVCPSGPSPRWTRSSCSGRPCAYSAAAASRSSAQTGSGRTSAAPPGGRLRWSSVRLRSGSPSGAMRSSTWKIVTFSHGMRPYRPSNIAHGVRPPDTATVNRPRSATAACRRRGDDLCAALGDRVCVGREPRPGVSFDRLLLVAAELLAHRGKQPVGESSAPCDENLE